MTPATFTHVLRYIITSPCGQFSVDRVGADVWGVYSAVHQGYASQARKGWHKVPRPREQNYWRTHGFTLDEALDRILLETHGSFDKRVIRWQVSLDEAYDPDNSQIAYIAQPDWAEGKFVVANHLNHLIDCDGLVYTPEDKFRTLPPADSLQFYVYADFEEAQKRAERHVRYFALVRCVDCDWDTSDEDYMVTDEVWQATGLGHHDGSLCIGCLEKRIGRRLTWLDFTAVPVNMGKGSEGSRSERLLSRLCNEYGFSLADAQSWLYVPADVKERYARQWANDEDKDKQFYYDLLNGMMYATAS